MVLLILVPFIGRAGLLLSRGYTWPGVPCFVSWLTALSWPFRTFVPHVGSKLTVSSRVFVEWIFLLGFWPGIFVAFERSPGEEL